MVDAAFRLTFARIYCCRMSANELPKLTRDEVRLVFVLALISGSTFTAIQKLLMGAMGYPASLASTLMSGLIFSAGMGMFYAYTVRRAEGRAGTRAARSAIRSGTLPVDADPRVWPGLLDQQEAVERKTWVATVVFVALAIVYAVLAIGASGVSLAALWTGVVLFGVLGVATPLNARLRRRRIDGIRDQLEQQSADPRGFDGSPGTPGSVTRPGL